MNRTFGTVPEFRDGSVGPQLHNMLRDRIVSCEMPPGQRVSETEIAAAYSVSRQPVREAFIKLAEEGLVAVRPQRGTFVSRISVPAALTVRFIREAVEADLVRQVAECATPSQLAELTAQIAQQQEIVESGTPDELMRLDEKFHETLAEFAGEPAVFGYLKMLNVQMNRVRNIGARQFALSKLVAQHAAVVDAIRVGDAEAAGGAMRTHLREIYKDLPRIIKSKPDYFEGSEAIS